MRGNKFIGDAYEELTVDEMMMVQGSGEIEDEGAITTVVIPTAVVGPAVTTPPVFMTLGPKC